MVSVSVRGIVSRFCREFDSLKVCSYNTFSILGVKLTLNLGRCKFFYMFYNMFLKLGRKGGCRQGQ